MLGRLRMSTGDALAEYNRVAKRIFSKKNKKRITQDGAFKESTLEAEVTELVASRIRDGPHARMLDSTRKKPMGRAFVPPARSVMFLALLTGLPALYVPLRLTIWLITESSGRIAFARTHLQIARFGKRSGQPLLLQRSLRLYLSVNPNKPRKDLLTVA